MEIVKKMNIIKKRWCEMRGVYVITILSICL